MARVETMNAQDLRIIGECLNAALQGPFFPDWEFQTLMGFTREELAELAAVWPANADADDQDDAVNNVLNMLLGYPLDQQRRWHEYISVSPREVAGVLARWRGESELDDSAKGFFDRFR
ncbi:hypothetical protein [Spirillospora sp. NPDC048819]|uniref:hypothetical protein n=1 Tax=Spirillospora sp. NPDC048819 TaxID=3155268 RepID=UPI0033EA918D